MSANRVDAVWVWKYTLSNQKAVYGRPPGDTTFTKDYLQLPAAPGSLLESKFPNLSRTTQVPVIYHWHPHGSMAGFLNFSSDRYHLSWPTGAPGPAAWRLGSSPTAAGPETFPGDPGATTAASAGAALSDFAASGIDGVLVAVKLVGEVDRLHLRAYIVNAPPTLQFADASLLPPAIRTILGALRATSACRSDDFAVPGRPAVYFDPSRNHDSWPLVGPSSSQVSLQHQSPAPPQIPSSGAGGSGTLAGDDASAESAPFQQTEVTQLEQQISSADYRVPNATATTNTRGSAQRAFARAVKKNYGFKCAVTGISTVEFLVASHIVPWAVDESIRLDPSNGICLSTLIDRAFDTGFLTIDTNYIVHVDLGRISSDKELSAALAPYDGTALSLPTTGSPDPAHLHRRLTHPPI